MVVRFALTATLFILVSLGKLASASLRSRSDFPSEQQQQQQQYDVGVTWWPFHKHEDKEEKPAATADDAGKTATTDDKETVAPAEDESYYVFLQKFPLESSFKMLFHTEVVVCPKAAFSDTAFLDMLDAKAAGLAPSRFAAPSGSAIVRDGGSASPADPFAPIDKEQWSKQAAPGCVQLGYGAANCGLGCCGSPHNHHNSNYALNSDKAVISNAMGGDKELFFYGVSGGGGSLPGISGEDAYWAVCHGQMNAIAVATTLPSCVSNWAGRDYNPLTNNCNTFTSTVLKCVYGLSDSKPHLGVSDLKTVKCPTETQGGEAEAMGQCEVPTMGNESLEVGGDVAEAFRK